ncbi:uncharacterized protein LOC131213373 [Anopheles bellator]|uniref:uncharacterized protein LOC131213373 n=1 Tax=Anopheles bellator TaxID=139047 RepID=UPI0026485364|nr:uncharacterized protein LOC131213373 [Anopheles bellator]
MDDTFYERKASTNDGFTHGYYWNTGQLEVATDRTNPHRLPKGAFEVNMNHQHHLAGGTSATSGTSSPAQPGDTGVGRLKGAAAATDPTAGGYWGPDPVKGPGMGIGLRDAVFEPGPSYGYGDDGWSPRSGSAAASLYLGAGPSDGGQLANGGVRTGRKLPNPTRTGGSGAGNGSKRQLPQPKGAGSLFGSSDLRLAQSSSSSSPTVRKLPIPAQRQLKGGSGTSPSSGPQPPLIDNFNIDLSVKARKSIAGPIDDDGLKRLNSNIFGNSINYFCDLSQNKENFIATSAFYVNDDDADDYCYSDFFMTSSITLSSRKIKKLPKIQTIANHPRSSQSMSFIAADVNAAYRNFSMVAEAPYNDGTQQHQQQQHQQQRQQPPAIGYYEQDEYGGDTGLGGRDVGYGSVPPYGGSARRLPNDLPAAGTGGYCNHNPIYSEQVADSNKSSTHVAALLNGVGLGGKGGGGGGGAATKKQLPTIQGGSARFGGHGSHESLGYPYKPQQYPTTSSSSSAMGSVHRDEFSAAGGGGGGGGLHNGHREHGGYEAAGGFGEPLSSGKRPTLMNDRVTALKSRSSSRSSTPVSSGSGRTTDYGAAAGGGSNRQGYDAYQGYDAMSVVSNALSDSTTTTATGATPTTKLLPTKPSTSSSSANGVGTAKGSHYLARSPDKKPQLRRSPDRVIDTLYYGGGGGGDGDGDLTDDSFLTATDQSRDEQRRSSYERSKYGGDLDTDSSYDGGYGDSLDHLDTAPAGAAATATKKLPKVADGGGGGIAKKQLHFFDEREECFDEELEELEQANAAKQQQQPPGGNGAAGTPAGSSASTNALLEHGYDAKVDKLDPLGGCGPTIGGGAGGAGGDISIVNGTAGGATGAAVPAAGPDRTIVTDISKDITQQQQQQGKRDNFNARDKWLWAYDQIINVSTTT